MEKGEIKEAEGENQKVKITLFIISIIMFAIGFIPALNQYRIVIYLIAVVLAGYDLIIEGIKNIFHLNFEEDTLMTIAVIAAYIIGDYPESVTIVILFKLGEFIENKAVEKANRNINSIASIKVKTANLIKGEKLQIINAEELKIGDTILIKAGEAIPVDCKVISGETSLDTSSITGESEPITVNKDDEVMSGCINLHGSIKCKVIREYKNSTISKIVDLVYEATNNKGKKEEYITKFSKVYTPTVIIMAVLLAIIPPMFKLDFITWLNRALVFLVASCPCSIVISIPLAYFSCIGAISKKGLLIKGTKHIDSLAKANVLAVDKTGTITTGKMKVEGITPINGYNINEIMEYAYSLESNSNHPVSTAIIEYGELNKLTKYEVKEINEIPGCGIKGVINNNLIIVGNKKMMDKNNIKQIENNIPENAIIISKNMNIVGYILLKEEIRDNIKETIKELKQIGLNDIVMLTGDSNKNAEIIAKECGNIEYRAKLLPEDKLKEIQKLKEKGKVIFIGDGINDGPAVAEADFGIAMGTGSDMATVTADSILMSNNILNLPKIIKISQSTIKIVNENIFISILSKIIVLILGILGIAPVWLAVAADTGITLLTVINSIRIFKK